MDRSKAAKGGRATDDSPPHRLPESDRCGQASAKVHRKQNQQSMQPIGPGQPFVFSKGYLSTGPRFFLVALCWGRPVPVIPGGFVSARGLRFPPRVPRLTEDVGVSSTSTDVAGRAEGCPWRAESKLKSCSDEGAWAESEQDGQNKETKIRSVCAVQPQIAK